LTDKRPQLLENFFKPFSGLALVPSGKIMIEPPFLSLLDPSLTTFLKLEILFDLLIDIGFRQARAHPNIGIYNSSFFKIL
jgi:hypothetical protein